MARARAELMRNDCARVRVPVAFWSLVIKNTMSRFAGQRRSGSTCAYAQVEPGLCCDNICPKVFFLTDWYNG